MQYIQFQPQIGSQISNPPTGIVTVFVDVTDNTIKGKDSNGDIIAGSGGINVLAVTKANMDAYLSAATLTTGQYYKITGVDAALYGGTDIILQAVSPSELSGQGFGFFYNPKYKSGSTGYDTWNNADRISISAVSGNFIFNETIIGDQGQIGTLVGVPGASTMTFVNTGSNWTTTTHITGQTSQAIVTYLGYISAATYTVGDKVIWGGKVWQNLSSAVGTTVNPTFPASQVGLDGANWAALAYTISDYDYVCDLIEYDYTNDNISSRKDNTNFVRSDYNWFNANWGYNNISRFPWGNRNVTFANISNSYVEGIVNIPTQSGSSITNVSFDNGGSFTSLNFGWGSQISGVTSDKGGQLVNLNLGDKAILKNITIGQLGVCTDLYTSNNGNYVDQIKNITIGAGANLNNVYLYSNSYIKDIKLGLKSTMSTITLYPNSDMYSIVLDNSANFQNVWLYASSEIYYINAGSNSSVQNISGSTFSNLYNINLGVASSFSYVTFLAAHNEVSNITLNTGSYFQNVTFNNSFSNVKYIDLGIDAGFYQNTLGNTSLINFVSIGNNSFVDNLTLSNNSILEYIQLNANSNMNTCTVNNNITAANIKVDVGSSLGNVTFSSNVNSGYLSLDSSTFQASIDITGLGSINLNSYNYAGLITLSSSNSSESVALVLSGASFIQKLQPASGLTVTFLGTPVSGITQSGMIIMPAASYVTNGSRYDYITFDTVINGAYTVARQRGGNKYL